MRLVVVKTEGSASFQQKVLQPLLENYAENLECLGLSQAVQYPLSDLKTWDIVVIELSSLKPDDEWKKWHGTSLFTDNPKESPGELAVAATGLAEVVVCYEPGLQEIREHLELYGVHVVAINEFDVDLIHELWILRRAALPTGQIDVEGWIAFDRQHYHQEYPVPRGNVRKLLALELPHSNDQARLVREACDSLGKYDAVTLTETVILMRAARLLAQLELEGSLYCLTFLLGTNVPSAQDMVFALTKNILLNLHSASLPELEDLAELAQGAKTYISVDAGSGRVNGIYTFAVRDDHRKKLSYFSQLALHAKGVLFHLPGNRTVEVYTSSGLRFKYDGFAWRHAPLWKLEHVELSPTNSGIDFDPAHLVETIEQLSARRLSSIIAIDPQSFKCPAKPITLEDLRPRANLSRKPVSELDIEALISIFRLDGAHLIDRSGKIYKVAQNVSTASLIDSSARPPGTGRRAAQVLSEAFPSAVIVKVSASGGRIKVFKGGNAVLA